MIELCLHHSGAERAHLCSRMMCDSWPVCICRHPVQNDDFEHCMLKGSSVLQANGCFVSHTLVYMQYTHGQSGLCHATCIMHISASINSYVSVEVTTPLTCRCYKKKVVRVPNQQLPSIRHAHMPTSTLRARARKCQTAAQGM